MSENSTHLDTVIEVFDRMGIAVRWEHLGGAGGGLCRIRGKQVLFVDADADPATRLDRTITSFATLPDSESVYLVPAVRERVDHIRMPMPGSSRIEHRPQGS